MVAWILVRFALARLRRLKGDSYGLAWGVALVSGNPMAPFGPAKVVCGSRGEPSGPKNACAERHFVRFHGGRPYLAVTSGFK